VTGHASTYVEDKLQSLATLGSIKFDLSYSYQSLHPTTRRKNNTYLLYSRWDLELHDLRWLPLVAHDTFLVLFMRSRLTLDYEIQLTMCTPQKPLSAATAVHCHLGKAGSRVLSS
jgi:hypothetical protein